jgi:di/tricarboxylate transporter
MDLFGLLLMVYLGYKNSVRAKLKGQNPILWAVVTVVAYMATFVIGFGVVVVNFCKDAINMNQFAVMDQKAKEEAVQQLMIVLAANPLHFLTMEVFGLGGYMLVRYLLERRPDKKEPEIHWMDRMNNQSEQ